MKTYYFDSKHFLKWFLMKKLLELKELDRFENLKKAFENSFNMRMGACHLDNLTNYILLRCCVTPAEAKYSYVYSTYLWVGRMQHLVIGTNDGAWELIEEERLCRVWFLLFIAVSFIVQSHTEDLVGPSDWSKYFYFWQAV